MRQEFEVVTFRIRDGGEAVTTVNPRELEALRELGRLIRVEDVPELTTGRFI